MGNPVVYKSLISSKIGAICSTLMLLSWMEVDPLGLRRHGIDRLSGCLLQRAMLRPLWLSVNGSLGRCVLVPVIADPGLIDLLVAVVTNPRLVHRLQVIRDGYIVGARSNFLVCTHDWLGVS